MDITRRHLVKMGISTAVFMKVSGILSACGSNSTGDTATSFSGSNDKIRGGAMTQASRIGHDFKQKLVLRYSPVGFYFTDRKPAGAGGFGKSGAGCIMPMLLASALGKTVAFDEYSAGRNCAAFHLGFRDSIFPGVKYYLSHGPLVGGLCERFVKTPKLATAYLESVKSKEKSKGAIVFKPLENFDSAEKPEAVIFFANPDQLSALVYLLYFDAPPGEERVSARLASGCGAAVTLPLRFSRSGEKKAVWGLQDISARSRMPMEIMSFALPFDLLAHMWENIDESFLTTESWEKITRRIARVKGEGGGMQ